MLINVDRFAHAIRLSQDSMTLMGYQPGFTDGGGRGGVGSEIF